MANNNQVVLSWARGVSYKTSKCGNQYRFSTDGKRLWSYGLMIGYVAVNGNRVVIDFTSQGGYFKSKTTSRHVSKAKLYAHRIVSYDDYDPSDVAS